MSKRRKQPLPQTIGGILFGFEQQVLRNSPPPYELVHHARPDDPVPAADGTLLSIRMPDPLSADREAAWSAVHDALARLPGWRATRAELHGDEGRWHVTAVDAKPRRRQAKHEAISATGATEIEALERLAGMLRERAR